MAGIIFILGGSRSGKSTYALELAKQCKGKVAFIATCQALDQEMARRIKSHQKLRPKNWQTFEESKKVASVLGKIGNSYRCVIIDCITLLVSNLFLSGSSPSRIEQEIQRLLDRLKKFKGRVIIVSNEVGLGIVPDNKLSRDFRDIAGRINQLVGKEASEIFFMISGIPAKIKGHPFTQS